MRIRSITCFLHPGWPFEARHLQRGSAFIAAARPAFESAGYVVQTTRLATPPFPQLLPTLNVAELLKLAQRLEGAAADLGFDYVSLGPALPELPESYRLIPNLLAETANVFLAGQLIDAGRGVSLEAVRLCAQVIHQAARLTADGFANLRFAALANVPPGAPFFPAAYHDGGEAAFALAIEAADLAVQAFAQAADLPAAAQQLVAAIEAHAANLTQTAEALSQRFGLRFLGLDFTLAPFPEPERSFGAAMEGLGVPAVGLHGSLAAAAFVTSSLDQARLKRAGFNGLMLPVLEDAVLAERAAQGTLSVKDLLLYSAVCGTGLDTLPLPGEVSAEALAAVLLDLAALSQRLQKPLTARLMPIPGKQAGEKTDFAFAYFANSRVLRLDAGPLTGLLAGAGFLPLHARPQPDN